MTKIDDCPYQREKIRLLTHVFDYKNGVNFVFFNFYGYNLFKLLKLHNLFLNSNNIYFPRI
jgi:hypothetical protein